MASERYEQTYLSRPLPCLSQRLRELIELKWDVAVVEGDIGAPLRLGGE